MTEKDNTRWMQVSKICDKTLFLEFEAKKKKKKKRPQQVRDSNSRYQI